MSRYKPAKHRYLATHGDIDPAEYGGGYLVYVKPASQSGYVSLYHVEWDSDEDDATGYLYEADVRDRDIAAAHSWVDIAAVCSFVDADPDDWRRMARGTHLERARCLADIASYYGWHELDSYPILVTRADIRRRWARVGVNGRFDRYHRRNMLPGV